MRHFPLPPPAPPPSTLASLLAPFPRRAVLVAPRTAREVEAVVAEMKVLGLNQLWLDVFSGGYSHLDKSGEDGPDILTEALARTKGTGITVIPALDLLRWGADAPAEAHDLTALGETSTRQQASENHFWDMLQDVPAEDDAKAPPTPLWVSPAAPATEKTLLALPLRRRPAGGPRGEGEALGGALALCVQGEGSADGDDKVDGPLLLLLPERDLERQRL